MEMRHSMSRGIDKKRGDTGMMRKRESWEYGGVDDLRVTVTKIINELGIQPNVKGFFYLREAIIIKASMPEHMIPVTKIIYPNVAKMFDTSSTRVESAIRHAIEVAWEKGDICKKPFGCGTFKKKPTNSECIATVADCLDLYYMRDFSG